MPPFVSDIITAKRPCFFISPHLDDAALSCGGLISEIASKTDVTILTVFTKASESHLTLSARKALTDAHIANVSSYYAQRREEDKQAFADLPVKLIHLAETEALYRRKPRLSLFSRFSGLLMPEFLFIYPTYRFHMTTGKVSHHDKATVSSITKQLTEVIPSDAVVFAPFGVGNHVDHLVVRAACVPFNPIFWLDQPYLDRESASKAQILRKHTIEFPYNHDQKQSIIEAYTSQISLLFVQGKQSSLKEYYLIPK